MKYPKGKTPAQLTSNVNQSRLREHDLGYIDGYVKAADDRPYAVFVRKGDGVIDMVPMDQIKALFDA
jgi:hypothetical protein